MIFSFSFFLSFSCIKKTEKKGMVKFRDSSSFQSSSSSTSSSENESGKKHKRAIKHKHKKNNEINTKTPTKPRENLKTQKQKTNSRNCKMCHDTHYTKNCPAKRDVPNVASIMILNDSKDKKRFTIDAINLHDKLEKQKTALEIYRDILKKDTEECETKISLVYKTMEQVCKECPLLTEF